MRITMNFNQSTTMKNALKYAMLILAIAYPGAAFAGLIGLASSSAFVGSEIGLWLFAVAGLMLISLGDTTRRPINLRPASASPVVPFGPSRGLRTHNVRRRERVAA
jgi:hypothetical protein